MRWFPVARQMLPHRIADVARRACRGDAEQADAAQDEGHDRRGERGIGREAAAGDVAVGMDDTCQSREHLAADVVDRAGPAAGFERTLAPVEVLARAALFGAERDQVVELFELA